MKTENRSLACCLSDESCLGTLDQRVHRAPRPQMKSPKEKHAVPSAALCLLHAEDQICCFDSVHPSCFHQKKDFRVNLILELSNSLLGNYLFKKKKKSYDSMDCSQPGSSVHGILQARTLKWVLIPFSRASFQPRDQTQVSCIPGGFFAS